jgi:hypothetical protein
VHKLVWFVPEVALDFERAEAVVRALREAHPYEAVAFELYAIVDLAP